MPEPSRKMVEQAAEIARLVREISRRYVEAPAERDKARSGLTQPQIAALTALYDAGPLALKDLARALGLSHSTASGIVDRLERHGLVSRSVDGQDRRITRIAVTEEVDSYARRTFEVQQVRHLLPALSKASAKQREQISLGLRLLHALVADEGLK